MMSWSTSARLLRVEPAVLGDHPSLQADDECYYLLEYTAGRNFAFGLANDVINNLKKATSYRNRPEVWQHKLGAITECARAFSKSVNPDWLLGATLVPTPPSKAKDDPEYDDRIEQVLRQVDVGFSLDVRELVVQRDSTRASHASGGDRVTVEELLGLYEINEAVAVPPPSRIGVVDDMLTLGSHFRAMKTVLGNQFPGVPVVGFFVARRVSAA